MNIAAHIAHAKHCRDMAERDTLDDYFRGDLNKAQLATAIGALRGEPSDLREAERHLAAKPAVERAALTAEWLAGQAMGLEAYRRNHLASMMPARRATLEGEWA